MIMSGDDRMTSYAIWYRRWPTLLAADRESVITIPPRPLITPLATWLLIWLGRWLATISTIVAGIISVAREKPVQLPSLRVSYLLISSAILLLLFHYRLCSYDTVWKSRLSFDCWVEDYFTFSILDRSHTHTEYLFYSIKEHGNIGC